MNGEAYPALTETISRPEDFARLADPWDELVRSMPRPSPFLLHGWLTEWWRHYGGERTLAVHVARRGERLGGALPLCRTRRFGLRATEFLGGTKAPLADLLLSPEEDGATAAQLAGCITTGGVDYADLFGMPRDSRLAAAVAPGSLNLLERQEAPVLDLKVDWEAIYAEKLSSKARSARRRYRRRLETLGVVEFSVARTPDELAPALEDAFRLHALRWKGRRETSGFSKPVGRAFRRAALLRLSQQDIPRLVTLRLDRRAIAFALYLVYERTAYGLTMGFDPAFAPYRPGTETLLSSLEAAAEEGTKRVEFLGADAPYKRTFTDRLEPIHQGIGLASTLRGRAAVEALTRGIGLRRLLKRSQTARSLYYRVPRLGRG
jgi:CelD/BcsL family acetyltransferase involved in cellulose biosynthesis